LQVRSHSCQCFHAASLLGQRLQLGLRCANHFRGIAKLVESSLQPLNLCVDRVQRKSNLSYFRVGRRQHDLGFARLGQELTARLQLGAAAGYCVGQTEALLQARCAQRRIPGLPPQAFCLGAQYREGTALLFARLVLRLGSR
jgi:hypothetical protein